MSFLAFKVKTMCPEGQNPGLARSFLPCVCHTPHTHTPPHTLFFFLFFFFCAPASPSGSLQLSLRVEVSQARYLFFGCCFLIRRREGGVTLIIHCQRIFFTSEFEHVRTAYILSFQNSSLRSHGSRPVITKSERFLTNLPPPPAHHHHHPTPHLDWLRSINITFPPRHRNDFHYKEGGESKRGMAAKRLECSL